MENVSERASTGQGRRPWKPPDLKPIGTVADLVQTGMGKISAVVGDAGDPPFKPPGQS
jgi:hypothetical protein